MIGNTIKSKLQLLQRTVINHDCILGKFKFVGPTIPLTIGNHLLFEMVIKTEDHPEGELVKRKYTPISLSSQAQTLDFIFKIYRPNENVNFPRGGLMTPEIQKLQVGDTIDVEGPLGKFSYKKGFVHVKGADQKPVKKLVLIAGGSGIAPILNILKEIHVDQTDPIELVLLFANKSQQDVVLKQELQKLQKRVKIFYIIDKAADENWKGFTGYVNKEILAQISSLEEEDTFYASCGPRLMNELVRDILGEFPKSTYFKL